VPNRERSEIILGLVLESRPVFTNFRLGRALCPSLTINEREVKSGLPVPNSLSVPLTPNFR
jgi:hypothetical protein